MSYKAYSCTSDKHIFAWFRKLETSSCLSPQADIPGVRTTTDMVMSEQTTTITSKEIAMPFQFLCGGLTSTYSCKHRKSETNTNHQKLCLCVWVTRTLREFICSPNSLYARCGILLSFSQKWCCLMRSSLHFIPEVLHVAEFEFMCNFFQTKLGKLFLHGADNKISSHYWYKEMGSARPVKVSYDIWHQLAAHCELEVLWTS